MLLHEVDNAVRVECGSGGFDLTFDGGINHVLSLGGGLLFTVYPPFTHPLPTYFKTSLL